MSSAQAIQAVQMFTKHGASKKVSVVKEIVIGVTIGLGFGALWKVRHINDKRKIEEYYAELARLQGDAPME